MKRKLFQAIALTLCAVSCMSGCKASRSAEKPPVTLPDYTTAERELKFFGYYSPGSGTYKMDGTTYQVESNITVEKYQEYTDCGFNIVCIGGNDAFPKDATAADWEESNANKIMDTAWEAGCSRIIMQDHYFNAYLRYADLYGNENSVFASKEEFEQAVADRVAIYKDEPNFYGMMLFDEPSWKELDNYGKVYKALKKALPDAFFHCNLHPGTAGSNDICDTKSFKEEHGRAPTSREAYAEYFRVFFENTGADRVSVDAYPFLASSFKDRYFSGIQVMKEVCEEFGAELSFTVQSLAFYRKGAYENRVVSISDMWLQMNSLLGFGADCIAYYTYMPYGSESSTSRYLPQGSFLTKEGERTNVWYYGQEIMSSVKKFDKVLMNYKFQGSHIYLNDVIRNGATEVYTNGLIEFDNSYEFSLLKGVSQDNDAILATELKDEKNDLYMYMLQNIIDPGYENRYGYTEMNVTAEFPGYEWVAEYDCGELTYVKLQDGKYSKTLSAGYAVYLIPLK